MGTRISAAETLAALLTPVRGRLLSILYAQPDQSFQSAELIRLVGSGTGATHRQLTQLTAAGVLALREVGNQKHYSANPDCPIFEELRSIVRKAAGLAEPLKDALTPLCDDITAAFLYGSAAAGNDRGRGAVDIMIVSNVVDHAAVVAALQPAERLLGRKVTPVVMSVADWRKNLRQAGTLVSRVAEEPRVWLVGGKRDLA